MHPRFIPAAAWLLAGYTRVVFATCRVRHLTPPPSLMGRGPVLLALWHQGIFAVPLLAAPNAKYPLVGLMSPSRDGQLTRAIAARYGIGAAVGSSSRRSVVGVRELVRLARSGHSLFLTPDGPRGPACVAKEGATALAKLTGLPLIPAAMVRAYPKLAFNSWDTFWLPLPFAKVYVAWGQPLPPNTSAAQLTAALNQLALLLEKPLPTR